MKECLCQGQVVLLSTIITALYIVFCAIVSPRQSVLINLCLLSGQPYAVIPGFAGNSGFISNAQAASPIGCTRLCDAAPACVYTNASPLSSGFYSCNLYSSTSGTNANVNMAFTSYALAVPGYADRTGVAYSGGNQLSGIYTENIPSCEAYCVIAFPAFTFATFDESTAPPTCTCFSGVPGTITAVATTTTIFRASFT